MDFDVDLEIPSTLDRERYGLRGLLYDEKKEMISPHPSACYIDTTLAKDALTGWAAITAEQADALGLFKVDMLTQSYYDRFRSKQEILTYLRIEPDWSKLDDHNMIERLPHLRGHVELVKAIKPRSIQDLADTLALIRPGKIRLISAYLKDRPRTRTILYQRPSGNQFYLKKGAAIGIALFIVLVMNRMQEEDTLIVFEPNSFLSF